MTEQEKTEKIQRLKSRLVSVEEHLTRLRSIHPGLTLATGQAIADYQEEKQALLDCLEILSK